MNTLSVTEIKRRGIGIADPLLANGPVYIIKHNRPVYVLLKIEDYATLADKPAEKQPRKTFKAPDFAEIRKKIWGDRVFSKTDADAMAQWEKEQEGV